MSNILNWYCICYKFVVYFHFYFYFHFISIFYLYLCVVSMLHLSSTWAPSLQRPASHVFCKRGIYLCVWRKKRRKRREIFIGFKEMLERGDNLGCLSPFVGTFGKVRGYLLPTSLHDVFG